MGPPQDDLDEGSVLAPLLQHTDSADGTHDVRTKIVLGSADIAAAYAANLPNPFGPGYLRMYLFCALIALSSTMSGYDGSLMGSINALPNYTKYYDLPSAGSSGTGIVFAIFNLGQMAASFFIWLADWRGRRLLIFIGCLGVMVGTVITSTAPTLSMFIWGRFLLSFFSTWATMAAPLYMIEIAPPLYRGTLGGLYNSLWYMGSIIATSAVYTAHVNLADRDNLDWRLPLWLQMVCPGFVVLGIWFCPESPRWLVANGYVDEARRILTKYHANGIENHPLVELELSEMLNSLHKTGMAHWKEFFNLRPLVQTRNRRYRLMLNMTFAWFSQFSGNNIGSYFLPKLLEQVGITDTNTQLLLNIVYALTGWIAAMTGARFHDLIGRRKMFLSSIAGMVICFSITAATAAVYVNTGSKTASVVSIVFIYVFGVSFAWAFTSMQPIYPGEVMTNDMRARGMGIMQFTSASASFLNTFSAPIALETIGYWCYVFFVFWDCFEWLFVYYYFVETKGRTLEELDVVFDSNNPRKASLKAVIVEVPSDS